MRNPQTFPRMYSLYNGRRWAADQRKFTHALTTVDGGFLGGSGEDALEIVGDFPAAEIGVQEIISPAVGHRRPGSQRGGRAAGRRPARPRTAPLAGNRREPASRSTLKNTTQSSNARPSHSYRIGDPPFPRAGGRAPLVARPDRGAWAWPVSNTGRTERLAIGPLYASGTSPCSECRTKKPECRRTAIGPRYASDTSSAFFSSATMCLTAVPVRSMPAEKWTSTGRR